MAELDRTDIGRPFSSIGKLDSVVKAEDMPLAAEDLHECTALLGMVMTSSSGGAEMSMTLAASC